MPLRYVKEPSETVLMRKAAEVYKGLQAAISAVALESPLRCISVGLAAFYKVRDAVRD